MSHGRSREKSYCIVILPLPEEVLDSAYLMRSKEEYGKRIASEHQRADENTLRSWQLFRGG